MSWSAAEDSKLVAAVKRAAAELLGLPPSSLAELPRVLPENMNWTTVAGYAALPANRSGKACRLRYFNHLQPGLATGPFSLEEDLTVVRQQARVGNSWSGISALLPGRTDNAVKNR